jgi:CBS domain-containing protein
MFAGREHTLRLVRDLMTVGVRTCGCDDKVTDVARFILEHDQEGVIVLDANGHACGVIGQDELVAVYDHDDLHELTAEDVMRPDIPEIPPDIPAAAAAQLMRDQGVRAFYLMHHAGGIVWPAALITYRHLLRHIAAETDEDVADLGIGAQRQLPLDAFVERRDASRRQAGLTEGPSEPNPRGRAG